MKEILKAELIGLKVEIVDAENKSLIGIKGKIIDETKYLLKIKTSKGEKRILKKQVTLKLPYKSKILEVQGKLLVGRPYERIKK